MGQSGIIEKRDPLSGRGILLIALFLAFAFRLALALLSASSFLPRGDEGEYLLFADTLLDSGKFGATPTAYRLPLYPMLLAAVQAVTGSKAPAYLALNAFLGTASVALIYFLCLRLAGERAARISLLISVPNPFLMANAGDVLTENLYVPLVLAFLLAVVAAAENGEADGSGGGGGKGAAWRKWALAGVFLGLCNLTRPTLLRFGFVLPVLYLVIEKKPGARTRGAILALAVSIVFLLPWWIRNYAAFGHFIPATTGEGFVWIGCYNEKAFGNPDFFGSWVNYELDIDPSPFRGKTEYERDRLATAMAWEFASTHLADIPRTLKWKLSRLLHWYPHAVDRITSSGGIRNASAQWGFLFSYVLLYPMLAFEGWHRRKDPKFAVPALLCGYVLMVILATYGSRRLRLPIEGVLIVFAAAGWDRFTGWFRSTAR